ncbi:MAG: hypothetical protein V5A62_06800 [Haloarculaceae archaeon]
MVEKFGATFGSEAAERTELFKMVVTPDKGNCKLIKKQERDAVSSRRL